MKKIIALLLLVFLAGCIPKYKVTGRLDPANFEPYSDSGESTIAGQAFLKTKGGDVKLAAGNTISLFPATPYTREMVKVVNTGRHLDPTTIDNRFHSYIKRTTADAEGRFEFNNLVPGDYFLEATISWYVSKYNTAGGTIFKEVHVDKDEETHVVLTR